LKAWIRWALAQQCRSQQYGGYEALDNIIEQLGLNTVHGPLVLVFIFYLLSRYVLVFFPKHFPHEPETSAPLAFVIGIYTGVSSLTKKASNSSA
jgi:hypothetical protein